MQQRVTELKVKMNIKELDDGTFYGAFPQIGCIFVHGETEEQVYHDGREALEKYLDMSRENGDPLPKEIIVSSEIIQSQKTKKNKSPSHWSDTELLITGTYAHQA